MNAMNIFISLQRNSMGHLETQVLHEVRDFLISKGFIVCRFNNGATKVAGGARGKPSKASTGVSDLLCCSPCGRFCAIEIKKEGGKASQAQKDFIAQINGSGGIGIVVESIGELIQKLSIE